MTTSDFIPAQLRHIDRLVEEQADAGELINTDALLVATDIVQRLFAAHQGEASWVALNNAVYNAGMTDEDLIPAAIAPELSAACRSII